MGIKDALRGFAAAALVCTGISLLRSPFDAYFSGLGLIRLFSSGVLGMGITMVVTFALIVVVGLPIWTVLRRLGISNLWHFALLGVIAGALLASRVNPNAYRSAEYNRWAHGQETIRPALDQPCCSCGASVLSRRSGLSRTGAGASRCSIVVGRRA